MNSSFQEYDISLSGNAEKVSKCKQRVVIYSEDDISSSDDEQKHSFSKQQVKFYYNDMSSSNEEENFSCNSSRRSTKNNSPISDETQKKFFDIEETCNLSRNDMSEGSIISTVKIYSDCSSSENEEQTFQSNLPSNSLNQDDVTFPLNFTQKYTSGFSRIKKNDKPSTIPIVETYTDYSSSETETEEEISNTQMNISSQDEGTHSWTSDDDESTTSEFDNVFEDEDLSSAGYSQKLYEKLRLVMFSDSKTTVLDMLNMVQALKLRHNLTKNVIQDIIELLKVLAGQEFIFMDMSQYFVNQFSQPTHGTKLYTFYCPTCKKILKKFVTKKELLRVNKSLVKPELECEGCDSFYRFSTVNEHHFINLNVAYQLKSILNDETTLGTVIEKSQNARKRKEPLHPITDVHDGELFKKNQYIHCERSKKDTILTLNVNIDGGDMLEKSPYSQWSIILTVNELPGHLRYKVAITAATWWTRKEPDEELMQLYLRCFIDTMSNLQKKGFIVKYKGQMEKIFSLILLAPVDAKARPQVACRRNCTSFFGCFWCYIEGFYHKCVRFPLRNAPPFGETYELRTHEKYIEDEKQYCTNKQIAKEMQRPIPEHWRGVKGVTVLAKRIPGFDAIWSFPEEYLHSVGLGLAKQLCQFIHSNVRKCFVKGNASRELAEKRLSSICPPSELYRTPDYVKDLKKWKAADWLYWLIFYCVACLDGLVKDKTFRILMIISKSIYDLMGSQLTNENLNECELNIKRFVRMVQDEFEIDFMTFNIHVALHLVKSVRMCGPLWATSAFPAESQMGKLAKSVNSPKGVCEQITDRVMEYHHSRNKLLIQSNVEENRVAMFCKDMLFKRKSSTSNFKKTSDGALIYTDFRNDKNDHAYSRCYFKTTMLQSALYSRAKKTNNTVIRLVDGRMGRIQYFFLKDNKAFMKFEEFSTTPFKKLQETVDHLLIVEKINVPIEVSIIKFEKKILYMYIEDLKKHYVINMPPLADVQ